MHPYRDPMNEGQLEQDQHGCRLLVFNTVLQLGAWKTEPSTQYVRYLCGLREDEPMGLTAHEKARLGNLFDAACKRHRKRITRLPKGTIPGDAAVARNREEVTKLHIENTQRKRKRKK